VSTSLTDLQLDALREVANIGSGNAATALSSMLGRPVDLSVASARLLPLADAIDSVGPAELEVSGVVLPIAGEISGLVLLVFTGASAAGICSLLGVEGDPDMEASCLGEIGNILGASYLGALAAMTGLGLEPMPPQVLVDMLGAIVSAAVVSGGAGDEALLLDSQLTVEGASSAFDVVFVPGATGIAEVLTRLGI
jgi:chemotaxis protein CheC